MKNDKGRVKFVKENITLDEALAQISFLKKQVKTLSKNNEKYAENIKKEIYSFMSSFRR